MLQVVLLSVFTTSFAFTTHRYDVYESYGINHPITPLTDNKYLIGNSNGRSSVLTYERPKSVDGVVCCGILNEGSTFNDDGERLRVDVQYSYQYPYQWNNRPVPLNRVAVTEPTKFYDIFQNSDQNRKYDTGTPRRPVLTQEKGESVNQKKNVNKLNSTQGNLHVSEMTTQTNDVKRTSVINEQQITWNDDQHTSNRDNANVSMRSIGSSNYSNSLTPKQGADKIFHPTKTNNRIYNNTKTKQLDVNMYNNSDNNKVRNEPNNTMNSVSKSRNGTNDPRHGTKTTQDNEVTPRINEQKKDEGLVGDKWVWSNAEDKIVETTTLLNLDDRAAFVADACPSGTVKVGKKCIVPD